ncbi:hypothetical protein BH23ACT3_BH23ACT3_17360 [soil metagenome]
MIRVLATEMSDAGRLTRGKRYWTDRAVIDLVVGHGAVTAEVQGSRPLPYVVTLETKAGHRAPSRADVRVRCTCPDDDGTGRSACKHAVAAMFALADEVSIDPEVLARWRRSDSLAPDVGHDGADTDTGADTVIDELAARRAVASRRGPVHEPDEPDETGSEAAVIAAMLAPAPGPRLPPVPDLGNADHPRLPDQLMADVLADALSHLRIRWE